MRCGGGGEVRDSAKVRDCESAERRPHPGPERAGWPTDPRSREPDMKPPWLTALAACISLITPARTHAQPLFGHAESIECTVANADLVLVARLVEYGRSKQADGREGHEGTIDVEETLKQDLFQEEPYQRLGVQLHYPASVLADWKDHSRRLLVALKEDGPDATTVIALAQESLEVLTEDLKLLRDPGAVIRIAKETVRRTPAPVRRIHTFGLMVPREAVAGTRWEGLYATGGHLSLGVPVDERLERRAHDDIRSESYMRREEGVRALRFFRSEENVARAKSLLADPGWGYRRHAEENMGLEVRVYGVREEAYRTLTSWGVRADKPVIREEVWRPDRVRQVVLSDARVTGADVDGLSRFENLQELYLRDVPASPDLLRRVARLNGLRSFEVGGAGVTDEGLEEIAALGELRHLSLRATKVTGAGLKALAGLKNLTTLDLSHSGVTDDGLEHLAGLNGLRVLYVSGTSISTGAVAGLAKRRPDLKVIH